MIKTVVCNKCSNPEKCVLTVYDSENNIEHALYCPFSGKSAEWKYSEYINSLQNTINKRVLAKIYYEIYTDDVSEVKILEISPSGNYIKIQLSNGMKFWVPVNKFKLVEILGD